MNLRALLSPCLVAAALLTSSHAAHVLIDFGSTATPSGPTANGPAYNNLSFGTIPRTAWNAATFTPVNVSVNGAAGVSSAGLLDTVAGSSGWTISFAGMHQTATGANVLFTPGAAANFTGTIAPSALDTFLINGATATGNANTALRDQISLQNGAILRISISGLDDNGLYDLAAFSGRGNAFTNTNGGWSLVTGTATSALFQDAAGTFSANIGQGIDADGNDGKAILWSGVQSTGGIIAFDIISPDASSTVDLNALSIVQIPEPSVLLLGTFGVLGLLRRRRI
jgi:hypothetical protein